MEEKIVQIRNLSHRYSKSWAIQDISFDIPQRGVVGLLGSNGAGKSTTMNILCGVLYQSKGSVEIGGIDLKKHPVEAKKLIGFLPQNAPLYLDLTVDEYLTHCAHLRLMPSNTIANAVTDAKEKCGISHFSKRLIGNLSGGYRQRVGIAQAIIHHPKLVVLDEPTNGLDPNQILEVRKLIKEIALEKAVLFSSHILSEVRATCEEIKMIEKGTMVFSGSMDAFENYVQPNSAVVSFDDPPSKLELEKISGVSAVSLIHTNTFRVTFNAGSDITSQLVKISVQQNWKLKEIYLEKSSLDNVFAILSAKSKSRQL